MPTATLSLSDFDQIEAPTTSAASLGDFEQIAPPSKAKPPGLLHQALTKYKQNLLELVKHPGRAALGMIPGEPEFAAAYRGGLTPAQEKEIQGRLTKPLAAKGWTPERLAIESRKHPLESGILAALRPTAAPLTTAEYAAGGELGKLLYPVAGAIPTAAAVGAGLAAPSAVREPTAGRALGDILTGGTMGGVFGLGGRVFQGLAERGRIAKPLEAAGETAPIKDFDVIEPPKQPANENTLTQLERLPGVEVSDVPVEKIHTAPERLQYKLGAGREGAGLALTKAKAFNPQFAGVVTLMHDPENPGDFLMVNGHQRLALARRSGEASMHAQVLPEGTTFEQARAIGARVNIAEGRGTAVDAAKFMRESGTTPAQLAAEGIDLSETTASEAAALSKLSNPLFRDVTTGRMNPGRGVVIGRELADNQPAQDAILRTVRDLERKGQSISDGKLADLIRVAKGSATETEAQTDLFGTHAIQKSYAPQQSDIIGYVRSQLGRDKRLFDTVVSGKGRLEQGGTQVDVGTATGISQGAAARMAALDATAYSAGTETNGIIRNFARKLATSPSGARSGIMRDAYGEVYDALESAFGAQAGLRGVTPEAGQPPLPTQVTPEAGPGRTFLARELSGEPEPQRGLVGPGKSKGSTTLESTLVPGARQFLEQDIAPAASNVSTQLREAGRAIERVMAPASMSEKASDTAVVVARRRGQLAATKVLTNRALQSAERFAAALPEAEKDDFIDRYERGQPQATPDLRAIATRLERILGNRRAEVQALGQEIKRPLLARFYENYFPHLWKSPNEVENFIRTRSGPKGSLSGPGGFLKHRAFDYYAQAKAAGFQPLVDNPVTLVALKDYEMAKFVSGVRIMDDLDKLGLLKQVRTGEPAPLGYTKIDDKLGRVYRPVEVLGKEIGEATLNQREMYEPEGVTVHETHQAFLPAYTTYAPDDVARILNNHLSPGLGGSADGAVGPMSAYDTVRDASNLANMVQLGMSAFHITTTAANAGVSDMALAIQKAGRGDLPGAVRALGRSANPMQLAIDIAGPGRKLYRQFYGLSDYGPEYQKAVQDYIDSGASFDQSRQFINGLSDNLATVLKEDWIDNPLKALMAGNPIGAALRLPAAAVKTVLRGIELSARPIFEYIVPRAKAAAFMRLNEAEQAALPPDASEMARLRIAYNVQNSIDNRFGELQYDKLFWHNKLRDTAFIAFRAPGWLLGTFRELGGGAADLATGKGLTPRAAYLLALPVYTALLDAVIQYAFTGTAPQIDLRDPVQSLKNLYAPIIGHGSDGRPVRVWPPTYVKEIYHVGQSAVDLAHGRAGTLENYVGSKLNPVVQQLRDILTNRTYRNVEIRNPNDPVEKQLQDTASAIFGNALPFTVQNALRERQKGAGAESAGLASAFGLTPAPRTLGNSPAENLMAQFRQDAGQPVYTREQAEHMQERAQMRDLLRKDDFTGFRQAAGKAQREGWLTSRARAQLERSAKEPPELESFKHLSLNQAFKVFAIADRNERTRWYPALIVKWERADPNLRRTLLAQFRSVIAAHKADRVAPRPGALERALRGD